MNKKEIKTVSLIGLGAVGAYLASHLSKYLGNNFRVIADGERAENLKNNGLEINGEHYDFNVVSPSDKSTGPADLVIIITKMTGLDQACKDVQNQVGPDTTILTPLNGVESEDVAIKHFGEEIVLYSLTRVSAVKQGNTVSFNDSIGFIEFGEKTNETISPRVQAIQEVLEAAGIKTLIQKDMIEAIWRKFVCNVSENQVSALLGLSFGAWSGSENANYLRCATAAEVIKIAQKKGIKIEDNYATDHINFLSRIPAGNKASTVQDILNKRKTEVDMFAGTIIRLGKETGVPTPINDFLYHGIRILEEQNDGLISRAY